MLGSGTEELGLSDGSLPISLLGAFPKPPVMLAETRPGKHMKKRKNLSTAKIFASLGERSMTAYLKIQRLDWENGVLTPFHMIWFFAMMKRKSIPVISSGKLSTDHGDGEELMMLMGCRQDKVCGGYPS
jgi:hypothetical protein